MDEDGDKFSQYVQNITGLTPTVHQVKGYAYSTSALYMQSKLFGTAFYTRLCHEAETFKLSIEETEIKPEFVRIGGRSRG